MTEQGSETVNPGQAIYDALSDEAKAAVDALSDEVFTGDDGVDIARVFAESIQLVGLTEARSVMWSLICDSETNGRRFISLNVAGINVLSWSNGEARVAIDTDQDLSSTFRGLIREHRTDRTYESERLIEIRADVEALRQGESDIRRAFDSTLQKYADLGWKRNQRANEHRDDWRVKLAMIAEVGISAPSYADGNRMGLPAMSQERLASDLDTENRELAGTGRGAPVDGDVNKRRILASEFAAAGLTYTDTQVASFYTALQTKGFVILSGISGTGKSKFAQRFSGILAGELGGKSGGESIVFGRSFAAYMRRENRFIIPVSHLREVSLPRVDEPARVEAIVQGKKGRAKLVNRDYAPTDKNRGVMVEFDGDLADRFSNLPTDTFTVILGLGPDREICSVVVDLETRTDLAGTGAQESSGGPSKHIFLSVRPDWRDGKALIGYHNPLTGEYERTSFLDFVIAAGDDYRDGNRNAFFVILDEMNLAHVEYYFADVLSVIESGRDDEGWTVEGIPLAVGEEDADLPEVLKLPPNLYIVGTVNMDETTHPFSPKVLDRAFTIELTDVDFSNYPPEPVEGEADLGDEERQALLTAFTRDGRYPRIDKREIRAVVEDHPGFRDDLATLNRGLERYRMHFGHRVFDEIMQFVHNAEMNELFDSAADAFDHAVLMKVLPKFNGSRAKLENALFELLHWARADGAISADARSQLEARLDRLTDERQPFDAIVVSGTGSADDDWRYPATGRRAALMMQDLYTDGFASFG